MSGWTRTSSKVGLAAGFACQQASTSDASVAGTPAGSVGRWPNSETAAAAWSGMRSAKGSSCVISSKQTIAKE